ncbi:hypothetical protein [Paenibacillus sp. J22TS3]|uniref:hypothetical protein n=1 Tax=Paenibacillus sp. J22TS3 TaxID=2807192 RepID=UPI001B2F83F6|nr:hypothetical protein [Paenibacillus sp. J22TS3]GIP21778.1 hypothetical protein J22TS3_20530 [Paenibacillus sp. J22TS3]
MNKVSITAAAVGLTLVIGSMAQGSSVSAASTNSKSTVKATTPVVHTINALPAVKLTNKSSVRLSEVNILTQDEGSIVTYTLTFNNKDAKNLDLTDYWTRVRSSGGAVYSATLKASDATKKNVASGATTTLTYIVKVGKNVKISDLAFQIVKWDFSKPNYENNLGSFKIPSSYLISTPSGQSKAFRINEAPVKMKVSQVTSYLSGNYNYVGVTLDVQNIGYKLFEDPKVKMVVKTANGSNYPLSADSLSSDYRIQPQDTKKLNLMASIPKNIPLKNLELQVIQDDETSKMSLPLATLQLPLAKNQSITVKPYTEKIVSLPTGKLAASVKGAWMNQSYDSTDLAIQISLRNAGTTTITVPKYEFVLHTGSGYTLPITVQGLENMQLKPEEERNLRLNISIPSKMADQKLQLFVNVPQTSSEVPKDNAGNTSAPTGKDAVFNYPIGIFALPEATPLQNTTGIEQLMQINNGLLGLTLSNVQRLPWIDGDLVSAKITIANKSNKTIVLPELSGQFIVDSAKLTNDTKLINSQSVALLGAGKTSDLYLVSKLPSYLDFTQLQIALLEKSGEASSPTLSPWFQFTNLGDLPEINTIKKESSYQMNNSGRKEEFKVLKTIVYPGAASDIVYTELEVKNLEEHQIDLSQIVGYYKAVGGQTYRAKNIQIETPVGPEEKSVIALWTKIPSRATSPEMKLIIGEGVTDNKLTPIKGEATGYINAAAMELNIIKPTISNNLKGLDAFPYKLDINNVDAKLTATSSVQVKVEYNLTRNTEYSVGELGHKFVFEVKDSTTGRIFEKEATPGTDLKVGPNGTYSYSFDDSFFEKMTAGSYYLSVYDDFQGQRVKLATQGFYYNSSGLIRFGDDNK